MKKSTRPIRMAAFAALMLAATIGFAGPAAATHVGCGDTITTDTTLDSNIGPCTGTAITIGANGITLDLDGFSISGVVGVPGEGPGILLQGRTGVTVKGGTVEHFDAGIAILGGSSNTVRDMTVDRNEGDSSTDFGDGIAVASSHFNTIKDNTVTRNAPYDGIGLFGGGGSDDNTIKDNLVTDNIGTRTIGPHGTTEEDDGIRLENGSQRNTVKGNTVLRNGLDGIAVFFQSTDNVIKDNEVRDNGHLPTLNRKGDGIHVFLQANRTLVQDNQVFDNGRRGIQIDSMNNQILDNATGGNADLDLLDLNPGGTCDNNVWLGNSFTTALPACTTA